MLNVADVYHGSNSGNTRKLLKSIEELGHVGRIAAAVFRAQKASSRAKKYCGGRDMPDGTFKSYTSLAYETKGKALSTLCSLLMVDDCGMSWGWHSDACASPTVPAHVLYLETSAGQISWHSFTRYAGPEFAGEWDGIRGVSEARVIQFVEAIEATVQRLAPQKQLTLA